MKKKRIFNSKEVTELLKEYIAHPKGNEKLRNRILRRALPLISAAISKKRLFKNREDLTQDCCVKLMYAIPKYNPEKASAFAFMWTVICNHCITQNQKLEKSDLSLSSDSSAEREANTKGSGLFTRPENQHILNNLSKELVNVLEFGNAHVPSMRKHRKACKNLRAAIASGEFFYDRAKTIHQMKDLGLNHKQISFYTAKTLIFIRRELLKAKEDASMLHSHEGALRETYSGDE